VLDVEGAKYTKRMIFFLSFVYKHWMMELSPNLDNLFPLSLLFVVYDK
jgi:hypothetical protein